MHFISWICKHYQSCDSVHQVRSKPHCSADRLGCQHLGRTSRSGPRLSWRRLRRGLCRPGGGLLPKGLRCSAALLCFAAQPDWLRLLGCGCRPAAVQGLSSRTAPRQGSASCCSRMRPPSCAGMPAAGCRPYSMAPPSGSFLLALRPQA